jgi:hypothetical protein
MLKAAFISGKPCRGIDKKKAATSGGSFHFKGC